MALYAILLRSLRRSSATAAVVRTQITTSVHNPQNPNFLLPQRSFAFSSAEEAAAERRRRKRRLRIEPPINALRRDPLPRGPPSPDDPRSRLPDTTSALVGPRLNLHNRVQSLIRAGDLDSAAAVARHAVFSNTRPTVFTCNAIIGAMYRSGRYNDAKALFQYFFNQYNIIPNVVSYNHVIVSHCEAGEVDEGLKVYSHIIENAPFSPSAVTYRHLTKGLIDSDRIAEAVDLLREMLNKGHGADSLVYNNLILGFLNLGNLEKANELFDELKERCTVYDGVVNATFMDWFFKQGKVKEAMESYRSLLDKKYRMVPATCNVLLEVLLRHGRETEAWALFDAMLDDHTPPTFQAVNSDTFNLMVNECFRLGKVSEALETFKKVGKGLKTRPFAMDVAGYNNMITKLSELEMMEEAEKYYMELCNKSLSPDVTTYRTMIEAYVKMDSVEGTLEKYTKMVEAGLRVIPVYAEKWFNFLIEKGKVAECVPILTKMGEREPKPDVTIYDIVIRALCGEGNYDASSNLVIQTINYGVGLTSSLREFLLESFGNQGRREEIERVFATKPTYIPPSTPPRGQVPWLSQLPRQLPGTSHAAGQQTPPASLSSQVQGRPSVLNSTWQQNSPPSFVGGQQQASSPSFIGGQGSSQMQGQQSAPNPRWQQASPPSFVAGQGSHQMQGQQSAPNPRWQQASPPSFIAGQVPQQMQGQPSTFARNSHQASPSFIQQGASPPSFMAGQGSQQMQGQPSAFARNVQQASQPSFVPQQDASSHSFMAGQGSQQMQGQPSGFTHVSQWSSPPTYMAGQGGQHQNQGQPSGFTQTPYKEASPYSMDGQRAHSMQGLTSGPVHTPLNEISHTSQSVRGPASAFAHVPGQYVRHQAIEKASSQGDNIEQYQYPEVARQGRM
ncbi:pentatricopeptide repeat-containing protein At1g10270 isoform X7 [Solanum verrucosum]|uniref:pentatricopeptide repeat-containing protein At1g10270 isoform X6 n=1 Tax=Solanum verrucosum TaxID=315347 RepID=UPI0020D077EC|nr:pentatricopeptide repeat-containing protein At1g10270 isoform X6 [Solanum verrucosum]XP_049352416.1 pentatricopeptide repeat-containing protein At1g10270 isoform X7 [Solanum verrucosum]